MFCTLRRSKDARKSYALRIAEPPFARSKGRLSATACIDCRAGKTKCTSEPNGCKRCLIRNRPCQYPPLRQSQLERSQEEHIESSSAFYVVPDEHQVPFGPSGSQSDPNTNAIDNTLSVEKSPTNPELTASSDCNVFADPMVDSPMNSFTLDPDMDPWNDIAGDGSSFWGLNMNQATNLIAPVAHEPACSCFSRAIELFEFAEMHLVWNVDEQPATGMELLQQQKSTIADCQSLLDCDQCTDRSSFALLLISICGKVASSLHKVSCGLQSSSTRVETQNKGRQSDQDFLQLEVSSVAQPQLDGDDRLVVLASLFRSRVGRLCSLVAALEALVTEKQWHVHLRMTRVLKRRVRLMDGLLR